MVAGVVENQTTEQGDPDLNPVCKGTVFLFISFIKLGGRLGTEVAFTFPTQPFRVRFLHQLLIRDGSSWGLIKLQITKSLAS